MASTPKLSQADQTQQEQIDALTWLLAETRTQLETTTAALNETRTFLRNNWSSRPAGQTPTATTGDGLFPCNATSNCQGHKTQQHVQVHQQQVAKKQQTAS